MAIRQVLLMAQNAIKWAYDKTFDLYGETHYLKPNGATGVRFGLIQGNVACRLSVNKLDNTIQGEATKLMLTEKLFCDPDVPIKAGSRVVVDGVKYQATKEPKIYDTHLEVLVERHEWA